MCKQRCVLYAHKDVNIYMQTFNQYTLIVKATRHKKTQKGHTTNNDLICVVTWPSIFYMPIYGSAV